MQLSELLTGLATEIGFAGLELDEKGIVSLDVDGMTISIAESEGGSAVVLRGYAGEVPPEGTDTLRKMLLDGNLAMCSASGNYFASDSEQGHIILVARESLASITIPDFLTRVETFINTLESWRKVIEDFRGASAATPQERPKADSSSNEFMRV